MFIGHLYKNNVLSWPTHTIQYSIAKTSLLVIIDSECLCEVFLRRFIGLKLNVDAYHIGCVEFWYVF